MKLTIIGCGNMGSAFAKQLKTHHDVNLYDRNLEKTIALEARGYGTSCKDLDSALQNSEYVILAIKPQSLTAIANEIKDLIIPPNLVSLLAGTTLKTLKGLFPQQQVIRVMPNLAVKCGKGMLGVATDEGVRENIGGDIESIFSSLGKVYFINEDKMDAFTALAGSGPAFIFAMIEAMVESGIAIGFNAATAQDLIVEMMSGSLYLLNQSKKHPAELKWQVCSPEGTTIEGLRKLEENAIRAGIMNTFLRTYERAKEFSKIPPTQV